MNGKRIAYWTALAVTGLTALALRLWMLLSWSGDRGWAPWWNGQHGPHGVPFGPFGFGFPVLGVLLVVGLALWYRRQGMTAGVPHALPWETLGMEYVEGRITRDEFLTRRAVLEELRWK